MIALLLAAGVAAAITLVGTPFFVRLVNRHGIGQEIREDGPGTHLIKQGTPTMGGVVILAAVVCGYFFSHLSIFDVDNERPVTWNGLLALGGGLGMGVIGFMDDFLKFRNRRSLGLNKTGKIIGQVIVALLFAWLARRYTDATTEVSFVRPLGIQLPIVLFTLWVLILFTATSNAVNLTDGLDGLSAGSCTFVFGGFVLIAFWQFRHDDFYTFTDQGLDLAVVAAAYVGACAGFLWWNAAPAKIFMGDTGSLSLGGSLAALAFLTNTQLLLPIMGGLFVMEALSVIAQVFSFRVFGKRVLRMAPVHHHFELLGWSEITVVVRFWIVAAAFAVFGVALFYADWLSTEGV